MTEIMAGAEPFHRDGNDIAVLVLHGFTGSTQSMLPLADALNARYGFTVTGPRLAGHGTSPDDMDTTGYMDGTLTLNLSARFPAIVRGAAAINAPVGILDGALAGLIADPASPRRIPGIGSDIKRAGVQELAYSEVSMHAIREAYLLIGLTGDLLPKIACPLLAIHSREDHIIPPANGHLIVDRAGSDDVRLRWLTNSYHVATLDNDFDLIVRSIGTFIAEIDSHRD
jgi:carboxylesterase